MIKNDLLALLKQTDSPLSVPEILLSINANKTTIYRELESFSQKGVVKEIEFGDGKKRYEIAAQKHHHHLICNHCGKVMSVNSTKLENDIKGLIKSARQKGFVISTHNLEFFGLCKNCTNL